MQFACTHKCSGASDVVQSCYHHSADPALRVLQSECGRDVSASTTPDSAGAAGLQQCSLPPAGASDLPAQLQMPGSASHTFGTPFIAGGALMPAMQASAASTTTAQGQQMHLYSNASDPRCMLPPGYGNAGMYGYPYWLPPWPQPPGMHSQHAFPHVAQAGAMPAALPHAACAPRAEFRVPDAPLSSLNSRVPGSSAPTGFQSAHTELVRLRLILMRTFVMDVFSNNHDHYST